MFSQWRQTIEVVLAEMATGVAASTDLTPPLVDIDVVVSKMMGLCFGLGSDLV